MTQLSKALERGIGRVVTLGAPQPGFVGEGHEAIAVVEPGDYARTDPFILLMDDRLDLAPGGRVGEAHPHAGFETVTFVLEGGLRDRDEGTLEPGDMVWMTAGSGVIHNEDVVAIGRTRILQLWLKLPSESRWVPPRIQSIKLESVPVVRAPGVEARVYSGRSGDATASTLNYTPTTIIDVRLAPGSTFEQEIPGSYNGFIFVVDGEMIGGAERTHVTTGQVAWLADVTSRSDTVLHVTAGDRGCRFVLYAGERQSVPIVSHGPFIGESRADLIRISNDYVRGQMPRVSQLSPVAQAAQS
jgi:redox-sensitive bicupin YhaK (pirin superfamily)